MATKRDRCRSAREKCVLVPSVRPAQLASHRDLPVRVGAGPKEQTCWKLLILRDGLQKSHVQRVLETLVRTVAPQPSVQWLVDRIREIERELSIGGVVDAPPPEPVDHVGLVRVDDVVSPDPRGGGPPLQEQGQEFEN